VQDPRDRASYQAWAGRARQVGLGPALVILLEMIKPAGVLCGQLLEAAASLGGPKLSALGRLCQEPEEISALQALIMDEARPMEEGLGDA